MDAQKRDLCRLCLGSINGCDELLLNNSHHLIQSILLITGLEVVSDPGQCEYLCSRCHPLLQQCVEFRSTCINNDGVFRTMMTSSSHIEDCKLELQEPTVECIKQEPVDLGDPAHDVNDEMENSHILPQKVNDPSFESKIDSKQDNTDGSTEPLKSDHVSQKDPCPQCGVMVSRYRLNEHQRIHNSNRRAFGCPHCPKEYRHMTGLKQHINSKHTHEIQYTCDDCGKAYFNRDAFMGHCQAVHSGEKKFACTACGERFPRSSMRYYHEQMVHSLHQTLACEYCDKKFPTRKDLARHIDYHNRRKHRTIERNPKSEENSVAGTALPKAEEKAYKEVQCQECGKLVKHNNLSEHQEIHNPSRKKLSCPHCPKEYLLRKGLREHIHAVHTQGIQYACSECAKSFATRRSYYEHREVVHKDERRYECKICGETFTEIRMRTEHRLKVHLTPFACKVCDKAFPTKKRLLTHSRKHLKQKLQRRNTLDKFADQQESSQSNASCDVPV